MIDCLFCLKKWETCLIESGTLETLTCSLIDNVGVLKGVPRNLWSVASVNFSIGFEAINPQVPQMKIISF